MNKITILIILFFIILSNSIAAAGFVDCLYSRPDYTSKPSYTVPTCIKIIHLENYVDKKGVLWCHIKFTGFIVLDGWIAVAQLQTKDLPGRK